MVTPTYGTVMWQVDSCNGALAQVLRVQDDQVCGGGR